MLIDVNNSVLAVIDIQEKLVPGVHQSDVLINNTQWLIKLANVMGVPVVATEQYPQGVGHTVEALRELIEPDNVVGKTVFSCVDAPECKDLLPTAPEKQLILCGMETHVCIMQTALQLHAMGRKVFVVADAVSSRNHLDSELAIERMRQAGIAIVSKEMVGFEWVRGSGHPEFKTFSREFLR